MAKNKLLPELEWMDKHVQGRTWGWEELVLSGRASLDELEDGPLKKALNAWRDGQSEAQRILNELGYEAG